jgi:hypothetical protein
MVVEPSLGPGGAAEQQPPGPGSRGGGLAAGAVGDDAGPPHCRVSLDVARAAGRQGGSGSPAPSQPLPPAATSRPLAPGAARRASALLAWPATAAHGGSWPATAAHGGSWPATAALARAGASRGSDSRGSSGGGAAGDAAEPVGPGSDAWLVDCLADAWGGSGSEGSEGSDGERDPQAGSTGVRGVGPPRPGSGARGSAPPRPSEGGAGLRGRAVALAAHTAAGLKRALLHPHRRRGGPGSSEATARAPSARGDRSSGGSGSGGSPRVESGPQAVEAAQVGSQGARGASIRRQLRAGGSSVVPQPDVGPPALALAGGDAELAPLSSAAAAAHGAGAPAPRSATPAQLLAERWAAVEAAAAAAREAGLQGSRGASRKDRPTADSASAATFPGRDVAQESVSLAVAHGSQPAPKAASSHGHTQASRPGHAAGLPGNRSRRRSALTDLLRPHNGPQAAVAAPEGSGFLGGARAASVAAGGTAPPIRSFEPKAPAPFSSPVSPGSSTATALPYGAAPTRLAASLAAAAGRVFGGHPPGAAGPSVREAPGEARRPQARPEPGEQHGAAALGAAAPGAGRRQRRRSVLEIAGGEVTLCSQATPMFVATTASASSHLPRPRSERL